MTLREQLAERLQALEAAQAALATPGTSARVALAEHYGMLADECIRQMEWARTRRVNMGDGTTMDGDWGTSWHIKPLTTAPDDWKPE